MKLETVLMVAAVYLGGLGLGMKILLVIHLLMFAAFILAQRARRAV